MKTTAIDILTTVLNYDQDLLAVQLEEGLVIHVVLRNIMGDKSVTVADYDGNAFLVKFYDAGKFVFENITTTPVELIRFVLNNIK